MVKMTLVIETHATSIEAKSKLVMEVVRCVQEKLVCKQVYKLVYKLVYKRVYKLVYKEVYNLVHTCHVRNRWSHTTIFQIK
jgi:hypothetical protein